MKIDDPTPTYRGYRRQALYALSRLFDDVFGDDASVQPEGVEDLAVYDSHNMLVEVVQVKDYTSNLVASSFKPFFYDRIAPYCQPNSATSVKVASFGPIGPDLLDAKKGDSVAKKRVIETIAKERVSERKKPDGSKETFTTPGLSIELATKIVDKLELQPVSEVQLTEAIEKALSRTVAGTNPKDAFEFLMWWIITSSESKRIIRRRDAIQKLERIGSFLTGREAFHTEWFRSIIPLSDDSQCFSDDATQSLKEAFFRGGRVSFEHILAGVDVPRGRALIRIHEAFSDSNVVIVHSASGQGKTTLAFRYLKEFAPSVFRLQLHSAETMSHARQMAMAIRQQSSVLGVPTLVYIDVRPGDIHWVEQVRELSAESSIRVLVTIREEDWQRSFSAAADIFVTEVSLEFDSVEANQIYDSLRGQQLTTTHLDFDEAWKQFGPRKCLLEFVYFVTQAESLTTRIKAQVTSFQEEVRNGGASENEEHLLRLVAVASSYEARLDLVESLKVCNLTSPLATLRRFENEYFIRQSADGSHIDGFHAIRSEVLAECLTDRVVLPWSSVAAQCIPLIDERDLESFLLCTFSRRYDAVADVMNALAVFEPRTWPGACGVVKSLMWLGLKEYWEENRQVLDEAHAQATSGWILLLESDVARVRGGRTWNVFETFGRAGESASKRSQELKKRQTSLDGVFSRVEAWLTSRRDQPLVPTEERDWLSMAEVMYWCGILKTGKTYTTQIDGSMISDGTSQLPLYLLGDFMRGVREAAPTVAASWLQEHRTTFLNRVRHEAAIVTMEESDDAIVSHYIIDLDTEASRLERVHDPESTKASLNDLTMERVRLLNDLLQGKFRYGAVGYGHRQAIFAISHDEANKSGVLAENLYPHWSTGFNGLSRNHCDYRFRPSGWREFFERMGAMRSLLLECLADLRDAVERSRRSPNDQQMVQNQDKWGECRKVFNAGLPFPQQAVDEWGFISETSLSSEHAPPQSRRRFSARRFHDFREALNDYTRTATNFLDQSPGALLFVPALNNAKSVEHRKKLMEVAVEFGVNENSFRLSVINGIDLCSAVNRLQNSFESLESLNERRNHDEEHTERREVFQTIDLWAMFVYPPKRRESPITQECDGSFEWALKPIRNRLRNELQSLRRHGIVAKMLPYLIVWDGKSGLWIKVESDHPLRVVNAIGFVWEAIRRSFDPDTSNPVPYFASKLIWNEIVVILTVNGQSIEQQAFRRFKHAAFRESSSIDDAKWAFVPESVPDDIWRQAGLNSVVVPPPMDAMNRFVESYGILLQHVQHVADFKRIPDPDEFGMSILQEYLHRESSRAEPLLQATLDALTELFRISSSIGSLEESPDLVEALRAIVEIGEMILPTPSGTGDSGHVRVTVDQMVEWKNRLVENMGRVGQAKLLWMAHLLKCPAFEDAESS